MGSANYLTRFLKCEKGPDRAEKTRPADHFRRGIYKGACPLVPARGLYNGSLPLARTGGLVET